MKVEGGSGSFVCSERHHRWTDGQVWAQGALDGAGAQETQLLGPRCWGGRHWVLSVLGVSLASLC